MMLTGKRRRTRLLIAAVLMNLFFFLAAYLLRLPMWLDTTGTIYVSMLLGFHYGFVAGLLNSVISSMFFYGASSMGYYVVSLVVAFTVGKIMQKRRKFCLSTWLAILSAIFLVAAVTNVFLTFLLSAGIPSEYWSNQLYWGGIRSGLSARASTALSVSLVKLNDSFVSMLIVAAAYHLTPVSYRSDARIVRDRVSTIPRR